MNSIKQSDMLLYRNTETGEYGITEACSDQSQRYVPTAHGTFDLQNQRHVLDPLSLVGLITPIKFNPHP